MDSNMEINNKSSKFKIVFVIVGVLLFFVGAFVGYFVGIKMESKKDKEIMTLDKKNSTTKKTDSGYESPYKYIDIDVDKLVSEPKEKTDVNSNIQIEKIFKYVDNLDKERSELYILAKNNNTFPIDVSFYLNYYDTEGYNIDHAIDTAQMVGPGNEFVINLTPNVKKDRDVKTYKLVYSATKEKSYNHYVAVNAQDFKVTESANEFSISYTNNTGKTIQYGFNAALIFYKGSDVVFAHNVYMGSDELTNGKSAIGTVYKSKLKDIQYDKYKIVSSSAFYQDANW